MTVRCRENGHEIPRNERPLPVQTYGARRIRCNGNDLPGEKLDPKEVDQALVEHSTASSFGGAAPAPAPATATEGDDGVGGIPDVMPALAEGVTPPAGAGTHPNPLLNGGNTNTFTEEEEADLDDYNMHDGVGGGIDDAVRANSIIVQIDPMLEESSVSSVAPKGSSASAVGGGGGGSAAAASSTTSATAAGAAATAGVDRSVVCADDGGDENEFQPVQPDGGVSSPVGCGCGRRRGKAANGP